VAIFGALIASAAVALSIISPDIRTMWLLFGFIGGIGMGIVYLPSIIIIGYYFEKKRAIATGNAIETLIHLALTGIPSFRHRHCWHWRWFDRLWTSLSFSIRSIWLETCSADLECNPVRLCHLLDVHASNQTDPQTPNHVAC
jgi:MFS family permease